MSVRLLGFDIDNFSFEGAIEHAMELLKDNKVSQVVTINPEMFKHAEKNTDFKNIVEDAEMVIPDGIGVKIALWLKGESAERIAGIDFARRLLEKCAEESLPVGIIGAKEEIISLATENLKKEIENLNIVYWHNGYFQNDDEIYEGLKEKSPRLILVAMGSPRQEEFIYRAKSVLNPALMVGIGGSLDVWSGVTKRAPKIYQKLGLEWLYRTVSQPERFKRIFPTLPLFLLKVIMYRGK
ncbi:WecB/TagA/CpsF family glycosyltransferase [bacterium]|nr:WecB/TagA/CpsF family glycosyltransferase [bacterium]